MITRAIRSLAWHSERWSEEIMHRKVFSDAGVSAGSQVRSYTTPQELLALHSLARALPDGATALEIGSHLGASARYLAAALKPKGGILYCVDTWHNDAMPDGQADVYAEFEANTRVLQDVIEPLRGYSTEVLSNWTGRPVDFAFIDGDHSYEAVRDDTKVLLPLLSKRCTIAFHDFFAYPGVAMAVGELLAQGEWRAAGSIQNLLWLQRPCDRAPRNP